MSVVVRDRSAKCEERPASFPEASMTQGNDNLPTANSPQGAPGYNGGNPGIASGNRPAPRREDIDNESFWHRSAVGDSTQQGQQVNVGDSERAVSVAAGAIVGLLGLSRRS